jgi:excisionase family DNA binding protein
MPVTTVPQRTASSAPRRPAASHNRPEAPPRARPLSAADEWLTVKQVCAELKIGRRTFERWRTLGTAPRAVRLAGNGPLRIRRSWLDDWMEASA